MSLRRQAILFLCLPWLGIGPLRAADWLETRVEIQDLADAGQFAAASAKGETLLELVRDEFGDPSRQLADTHLFLASVYRQQGNFVEAELQHIRSVEILQDMEGALSTALIDPLLALGDTYQEARNYTLAMAAYDEARTIGRREYGLLNQDQILILEKMSESAVSSRDYDRAMELQLDMVNIVRRFHGDESMEALDAKFRHAAWLQRFNRSYTRQEVWRAYLDIESDIDDFFDNDPWLRIRALRASAGYFRRANGRGQVSTSAPLDLRRALKIVEKLDEPDPLLHASVLLDIGDWYVTTGESDDSSEAYAEVWELLAEVENGDELRDEWFGQLSMLRMGSVSSRYLSPEQDAPWGRVEIAFSIDTEGRPGNIRVVAADPPGLLEEAALRQIASSRFRPRMANGQLIRSNGLVGWDYQYNAADAERADIIPVASDNRTGSSGPIGRNQRGR